MPDIELRPRIGILPDDDGRATPQRDRLRRAWLVLIAVSLTLLFASGVTFASLGIPLFAMAQEFRWSEAAAGGAFLAVGLICAATSLAPMLLIPRIGARWTVTVGMILFGVGSLLASKIQTLMGFYGAAVFFGIGFALVTNASGTYLVASWFQQQSSRMIGLYMMIGSLGGAVVPPGAGLLVASEGGWRFYWQVLAAAAMLIAVLCAVLIREPPSGGHPSSAAGDDTWGYRSFLPRPQFMIIAAAIVATQACMLVVAGVAAPHFVQRGWSVDFAARILGLQGLVGAVATGASGWLTERYDPKLVLAAALLAEAAGVVLLAFAHAVWMIYAFVPVFGVGWSVTTLAGTVLLLRYFGTRSGTAAQSTIWTLAGVATAGPYLAGLAADMTGSFVPALTFLGLLLLPIALTALMMAPGRLTTHAATS